MEANSERIPSYFFGVAIAGQLNISQQIFFIEHSAWCILFVFAQHS